MIVKNSFVL